VSDHLVSVEVAWCAACRQDCTVEVVQLPGDPAPIAICLDCEGGVELWWQPRRAVPAVHAAS